MAKCTIAHEIKISRLKTVAIFKKLSSPTYTFYSQCFVRLMKSKMFKKLNLFQLCEPGKNNDKIEAVGLMS